MKTNLTLRRFFVIVAVVLGCTLVILSMAALAAANGGGVPTVNGLFYGDGDKDNYKLLGSADAGRGSLYFNRTGNTLYLAVVVSNTVNDNVFGDTGDAGDKLYLQSAGWKGVGSQHRADALINSDNTELKLQCGDYTYEWIQGYLYDGDGDGDPHEADWLSDPLDGSGGGAYWPTVLISSTSSLQWNLNNAATYNTWDVTLGGNRSGSGNWKSPDDVMWPPSNNDVTNNGYPTYDSVHDWEWAIVYEMSIDVSACGSNDIIVSVPRAHNSPAKDGTDDVPICPDGCPLLGSIGDYVWYDVNGDGIQDTGESGLDGVTVKLYDGLGNLKGTTTTSGGGYYIFNNLSAGDYYIEFVAPSGYVFTTKDQGVNDTADSDANPADGRTIVTTLVSGETDLTWDAGLHRSSIGDRVWYDEDGNGVQENPGTGFDDVGFNGVDVYLYSSDGDAYFEPGSGDTLLYTTTTAPGTSQTPDGFPDGIYDFDMRSLGPGQYWVWVDETDLPSGYSWVSTTGGDHQLVDYPGGDDFSIDFGYQAKVDLALTKTVVQDNWTLNSPVTFEVVVTNEGDVDATGVKVIDFYWTDILEYASADNSGVLSGTTSVIWDVGDLDVGDSATMHITFTLTSYGDFVNDAEIYHCDQEDVDSTPNNGWGDPPKFPPEDDIDQDGGSATPTAVTLSSFAAKSSAGGSVSPLWLGLAGLTVLAAGSLFWAKRRTG